MKEEIEETAIETEIGIETETGKEIETETEIETEIVTVDKTEEIMEIY